MRPLPFLFVVACIALAACSSSPKPTTTAQGTPAPAQPKETAGDALKRQFGFLANGQYGREWDELHPAEQAIVSRDKYTECVSHAGIPSIDSVTVKDIYDDPITSPYYSETTSKAVTFALAIHRGAVKDTSNMTLHEVNVGGKWRWVMEDRSIAAYQKGNCP